jgi:hypothetical protein
MKKGIVVFLSGIICWLISPFVVAQDAATEAPAAATEAPAVTEPTPVLVPVPVPPVTMNTYPISQVDRPLALPRLMIRPELDLGVNFFNKGGTVALENVVGIDLGVAFGVIDNLEIGIGIFDTPMYEENIQRFPISISPAVHAGRIPVYGLYEFGPFFENRLRVAARLTLNGHFDADKYDGQFGKFWMLADALAKYKIHTVVAAVAGMGMGFQTGNSVDAFLFNFDMGALVQPLEPLAFRLTVGFHVKARDFGTTFIPLMLRVQYTLLGDLDLFVDTGFPDLNEAHANWFSLIGGAAYRVQF